MLQRISPKQTKEVSQSPNDKEVNNKSLETEEDLKLARKECKDLKAETEKLKEILS